MCGYRTTYDFAWRVTDYYLAAEPDVRIASVAERLHDDLAFRHDKQYVE